MKKKLSQLTPVFDFSAFLFPYVLVFYLVLFLLENVFSGFVSNNFDINYFLIPVIFFGFLAALSPKKEEDNPPAGEAKGPARWDFILIAGLVTLSFVILTYKTADLGLTGFFISIISAILVGLISVVILVFPETEKVPEEATEASKKEFNIPEFNYKKFFISPIGLSLTGLLLIILAGGLIFSLHKGRLAEEKTIKNQQAINVLQQPRVEIPNGQLLSDTPIFIQNGTGKTGRAASVAAFLRDFNLGNLKTGDADNANYKNAYIKFYQKDFKVASYITFLLTDNDKYKIVNMIPPADASQSGIILILGN